MSQPDISSSKFVFLSLAGMITEFQMLPVNSPDQFHKKFVSFGVFSLLNTLFGWGYPAYADF